MSYPDTLRLNLMDQFVQCFYNATAPHRVLSSSYNGGTSGMEV